MPRVAVAVFMLAIQLALIAQHNALRHTRGVDVHYYPAGQTEAIELTLVPGTTNLAEVGVESEATAQSHDWIELADTLREMLGRMPETGDTIKPVDYEAVYVVAPVAEERPWRWRDSHRVAVRFHSFEARPDAQR